MTTKTKPLAMRILALSLSLTAAGALLPSAAAADGHGNELARLEIYTPVTLTAGLSHLSDNQRRMVSLLIDAGEITDELFWRQHWGDREALLGSITDERTRQFVEINYGPWDRLADDRPFVEGYGPRPLGARFYPADMTKAEFEAWEQPGKDGLYSIVKRDQAGDLKLVPYREIYGPELARMADLLRQAADLAENEDVKEFYLGMSEEGRKSFRDVRSYRRRKRWLS